MRPSFHPALCAALILSGAPGGSARAEDVPRPGAVQTVSLSGGLQRAVTAIGERVPADRSQFLLEFIRRTYNRPQGVPNEGRDSALDTLLQHLGSAAGASGLTDTLPLPLPPAIWIESVFDGRESPDGLIAAILRSRGPSLLYTALLSLDDETRAWLATQRELLRDLAGARAPMFFVAAAGFRVAGGVVQVPGGEPLRAAWETVVGRQAHEPAPFLRALLGQDEGHLAFFYGAAGQSPPARLRALVGAGRAGAADAQALRRLYRVTARTTIGWRIDDRVFWRPQLDPLLLAADLPLDDAGRLQVPGTRAFWAAVLPPRWDRKPPDPAALAAGEPVDPVGLLDQVFTGSRMEDRRRYHAVLFASRTLRAVTAANARDAAEAVRAAYRYPALVGALERARLTDVAAFAAAARRAERLGSFDGQRADRLLAQFQGTLTLLTRSATRAQVPPAELAALVSSLSSVEITARGDYEGALVRWLAAHLARVPHATALDVPAAGDLERAAIAAAAGPPEPDQRFADWEGTRYRVDFSHAEAIRLTRLLGEHARPFLSSARRLVDLADTLGGPAAQAPSAASILDSVAADTGLELKDLWTGSEAPARYRQASAALARGATDSKSARAAVPALLLLADDLLARGLMELTYAIALGRPDRSVISADDAARRHDFGRSGLAAPDTPWQLPIAGATPPRGWHVTGAILGLDVRLSDFALVRLSSRPPPRKPTLDDDTRRVLTDTVVIVEALTLAEGQRDAIVAAMRAGRERLAAARTAHDADAISDAVGLSGARRSLLAWTVKHDAERVRSFLSPTELLWLGWEAAAPADLRPWGVAAEPRLGCLCLDLMGRGSTSHLAGRWFSGILATGFADLNLRLAELLAELQMPAPLGAPVLAPATLDLIEGAVMRDSDDTRGLVAFVQGLGASRVAQYLALLTTDGPLVPVEGTGSR